jgi:hypothetical protein
MALPRLTRAGDYSESSSNGNGVVIFGWSKNPGSFPGYCYNRQCDEYRQSRLYPETETLKAFFGQMWAVMKKHEYDI